MKRCVSSCWSVSRVGLNEVASEDGDGTPLEVVQSVRKKTALVSLGANTTYGFARSQVHDLIRSFGCWADGKPRSARAAKSPQPGGHLLRGVQIESVFRTNARW